MEIFPSERQTLDLKRYEKIFATQADKCSEYGFAMLRVNPSMTNGDSMTVVITSKGVVCCKFFEDYDDIDMFESTMKAYKIVHDSIAKIISDKVKSNKTLIDENKKLRFPISLVNIFPKIKNENLEQYLESSDVKKFSKECCMFSEDFNSLRKNFINTINQYLEYCVDSFLIRKAYRYDVKGRKYIDTPLKYYFSDIGLRNARIGFRQQEESHIMENIIYNELVIRGYNVDIGVVIVSEKNENNNYVRKQLEVDFVCNLGYERYYIQSALNIDNIEKREQEERPLFNINDSFRKVIIVKNNIKKWKDDNGVLFLGIKEFLLNPDSLKA